MYDVTVVAHEQPQSGNGVGALEARRVAAPARHEVVAHGRPTYVPYVLVAPFVDDERGVGFEAPDADRFVFGAGEGAGMGCRRVDIGWLGGGGAKGDRVGDDEVTD